MILPPKNGALFLMWVSPPLIFDLLGEFQAPTRSQTAVSTKTVKDTAPRNASPAGTSEQRSKEWIRAICIASAWIKLADRLAIKIGVEESKSAYLWRSILGIHQIIQGWTQLQDLRIFFLGKGIYDMKHSFIFIFISNKYLMAHNYFSIYFQLI